MRLATEVTATTKLYREIEKLKIGQLEIEVWRGGAAPVDDFQIFDFTLTDFTISGASE